MNDVIVTIEPVGEMDYESWFTMWGKYQVFYHVDIPESVTKRTWQRFFNSIEPVFCAVARYNGNIVGFVHYLFHPSTWSETNYCYLEDLYVCERLRGNQIGKQLVEYVQREARKRHASNLYWHTHEANFRGQRLYDWIAKKSGMIEYRMQVK